MKKERVEGALQFTKTPTLLYFSVNTRTAAFFSTLRSKLEPRRATRFLLPVLARTCVLRWPGGQHHKMALRQSVPAILKFPKRSADIGNIHRHSVRHVSSPVLDPLLPSTRPDNQLTC